MAKRGHKKGLGMLASDDITAEDLIQNAKEQASSQKSMGYVAGLDLQSDAPEGRAFTWMHIDGSKVKRYLQPRDMKHMSPDQIFYEKAFSADDAKKLPADFEMAPIE